jgi:ATP-dependent Clp protease ATP-binding subunit ClpA
MFERFTDRARRVVVFAQEDARLLDHNYIGTEHILLGLLREPEGIAARALSSLGIQAETVRARVEEVVGRGKKAPTGHIPFTPRAKKVLELSLREALAFGHNYIGTEHILLGLIREGDGVAAKVLVQLGADLDRVRQAVVDLLGEVPSTPRERWVSRWLRRSVGLTSEGAAENVHFAPGPTIRLSPAVEQAMAAARRLAGGDPVASHHVLLALLSDADSSAARVLAGQGLSIDAAWEALKQAEVSGTSDEPPEEAGGRRLLLRVDEDRLVVECADPTLVGQFQAAREALGDAAPAGGEIAGDQPAAAALADVWRALQEALEDIRRRAAGGRQEAPETGAGGEEGNEPAAG